MRNYVIIGGSSGIGKELVNLLADEEGNITATYNKNEIKGSERVKDIKFDVLTGNLNLNDLPEEIHGPAYCPGSINLKPFHRFTDDEYIQDFKLQVLGATNIIRQLLPRMERNVNASIVFFSTVAVSHGFKFHSQVSISKGAVEGLTRSLAAEFAPKIRVNVVAPSLTNTQLAGKLLNTAEKITAQSELNPMKRLGNALDAAEAAAFLLSPKSSWITGQILQVDGGFSTIK